MENSHQKSVVHYDGNSPFVGRVAMLFLDHAERFKSNLLLALLALLVWMPLPIGNEFPWSIAISEIWLFSLLGLCLLHMNASHHALPAAIKAAWPVFLLLGLYLLWLLLQTVQLPMAWIEQISPHAFALHLMADPAAEYASISIAPYATEQKVLEAAFLAGLFFLLIYLVDSRTKVRWLIYTVLIAALAEVLYGTMMVLSGIEYSFFIAKSDLLSHIGSATGTFHSRNSLAAYLEIALALGIGYMVSLLAKERTTGSWRHKSRQWIEVILGPKMRLRLLLILLCLGLVMTHSRGGNIAFFASLGVAGVLFLLFARKKPRATVIFLSSLIILDIVLIGSWVGLSKVMTRLEQTSIQTELRDDVYRASIPVMQDYLFTGAGAGSFSQLMSGYKSDDLRGVGKEISYAFNDSIQIIVETGIVGFILLSGVVVYCFFIAIQRLRRDRSSLNHGLAFASLMGVTAIVIHSMVDYPMQMLATSSMFMVLLALPMICSNLKSSSKR